MPSVAEASVSCERTRTQILLKPIGAFEARDPASRPDVVVPGDVEVAEEFLRGMMEDPNWWGDLREETKEEILKRVVDSYVHDAMRYAAKKFLRTMGAVR